jgi:hypothetical protein
VSQINGGRAIHNAWRTRRFPPGECLRAVRTWLEVPPLHPTAAAAWAGLPPGEKRYSTPPAGAPVWFRDLGAAGHVALSVGDGWVITTDIPVPGAVSVVTISEIEGDWEATCLGWSVSINGRLLEFLAGHR